MEPAKTLVVDDDFYAREALRSLIARDKRTRVWGAFADADDALDALGEASGAGEPAPDVILLDVRLHDRERAGIEAMPALHEAAPDAHILVISVLRDEATILDALLGGGDGYVWKNESAEGIADAIAHVAEGRFVVTPSIAERLAGTVADLSLEAAQVLPVRASVAVTEAVRQTVYLYCVCGMSAREIADELQLSVSTVNDRIKKAYQVLGATSRREAFEQLISAGEE